MHDDGARKARWTTRGYEQTLNRNEDFLFEGPRCGDRRLQRGPLPVTFEPRRSGKPSLDRASSRGRAGTRRHLDCRVSIPKSQGSTESLGYVQCERSHEFHAHGALTIRRLLVLLFRNTSTTHRGESRKTHR